MSTLTAPLPTRQRADRSPDPVRPPSGRRDRRGLVAAVSLVVICASVAGFADLYASAGHRAPVVVVDRPLVSGQTITADQIGRADISVSSGIETIPAADTSMVVGKRAATSVPAGALLIPADLTSAPAVTAGNAVVGLALKDGQLPASGVVPGDQVMIVQTATPGSPLSAPVSGAPTGGTPAGSGTTVLSGSGTGVLVAQATVVALSAPSANSSGGYAVLTSVEVPAAVAPDVATAGSAGQVSLVLLAQGSTPPMPGGGSA